MKIQIQRILQMSLRCISITLLLYVLYFTCSVLGSSYNNESLFSESLEDKLYAPLRQFRCAKRPWFCRRSRYRTLSGACNNLKHPLWGAAYRRYGRLLKPKYGDGLSSPPRSITGQELPSALEVSQKMFGAINVPDRQFTLFNVPFGQFTAHDMSNGNGSPTLKKRKTECCTDDGRLVTANRKHTCFPIKIPKNNQSNVECNTFTRTLTDKDLRRCGSHSKQPAEQITVVSAYMDLSLVYGNSKKEIRPVRKFHGGRLKMVKRHGNDYPPACPIKIPGYIYYQTGDPRSNQNPGLTMIQITYAREHNRIADALRKINPCWHDERLFQEARRINIAQYQQVTYYEWLPYFLGDENMKKHRLIYVNEPVGYIKDYDPTVDASVLNEHANCAYRFYHSLIQGNMQLLSEDRIATGSLQLHKCINDLTQLETPPNNYDSFIRGQCTQPQKSPDGNMDRDTRKLPLNSHDDLRAIDIQRGRDHGLASYNSYRERCGLRRAMHWNDFSDEIPQEKIKFLQEMYEDVNDVDLMVGGSLEKFIDADALAGPTFLCIMTKQFYRTRVGDRYFFEQGHDKKIRFTIEQLRELKKATIARLMCDNSNNIKKMQRHAFELITEENKLDDCSKLPVVDLNAWKDDKCDRYA